MYTVHRPKRDFVVSSSGLQEVAGICSKPNHNYIEKPQFNVAAHSLNYHNFTAHLKTGINLTMPQTMRTHSLRSTNIANNFSFIRLLFSWYFLVFLFVHFFFSFIGQMKQDSPSLSLSPVKCERFGYSKYENGFKSPVRQKGANVPNYTMKENNYFVSNGI